MLVKPEGIILNSFVCDFGSFYYSLLLFFILSQKGTLTFEVQLCCHLWGEFMQELGIVTS